MFSYYQITKCWSEHSKLQKPYKFHPRFCNLADMIDSMDLEILDLKRKGTVQQIAQELRFYVANTGEDAAQWNIMHLIPYFNPNNAAVSMLQQCQETMHGHSQISRCLRQSH